MSKRTTILPLPSLDILLICGFITARFTLFQGILYNKAINLQSVAKNLIPAALNLGMVPISTFLSPQNMIKYTMEF